jgi:pyruvate,water dikinase
MNKYKIKDIKEAQKYDTTHKHGYIVKGRGASPGMVSGKVKIIHENEDLGKVNGQDIIVTKTATADMIMGIKKSKGIITDLSGITCSMASILREFKIPCIVGTWNATTVLIEQKKITLDGTNGLVFEDDLKVKNKKGRLL